MFEGICKIIMLNMYIIYTWVVFRSYDRLPKNNYYVVKGSLGGETSVLRTFRMSGKELVKERVSKERVSQRNS